MTLIQHSVDSDWLFNTQSRVLQTDWFEYEINEKATLNINMVYRKTQAFESPHKKPQTFYCFKFN